MSIILYISFGKQTFKGKGRRQSEKQTQRNKKYFQISESIRNKELIPR